MAERDGRRAEDGGGRVVFEGVRQAVKLTSGRVHLLTRERIHMFLVGSRALSRSRLVGLLWSDADDVPSPWSSVGSDSGTVHYITVLLGDKYKYEYAYFRNASLWAIYTIYTTTRLGVWLQGGRQNVQVHHHM